MSTRRVVRHVTRHIDRPAAAVAGYVRDPANLPRWAAGLAGGVRERDGRWFADSPMGEVEVHFVADNPFGVCDHDVTLPDGSVTTNPLRVLADGPHACDVVFTLRQLDGVDDTAFAADVAAVTADLATLERVLTRG